ncbi:hypothetical protein ACD591_10880 [Rufibacter glacialis]|uniref:MarR family transcriptional regulator n=1 Tax=Rufibacter glacialis TaxID=1259555 RepID=A0A5M8QB44_9BACT|nr:hypothetical protein [Rufibacter glacialis]KAA6431742.1 hypothetical protein FOE74_16615 [Rufibacter glacialis]GGK81988.1 hypothetical protein GCM10011405_32170 [Rufibacter glacialis]
MTDQEFDIIDELYFVTSFEELRQKLQMPEPELRHALRSLVGMNFVKCLFPNQDSEVPFDPEHFDREGHRYYFLATKEGLLAHNLR